MLEQIEAAAELLQPIPETVQFFHDMENGVTYAVDVLFNKEDLLETIHNFDQPVGFLIGESYVHPNDRYCKKTGREFAGRRTQPEKAFFLQIRRLDDKMYLLFSTESVILKFRVNKHSEKPHLVCVEPA